MWPVSLSEWLFLIVLAIFGLLDLWLERATERGLIARAADWLDCLRTARQLHRQLGYRWGRAWRRAKELQ